jgi:drug/metabolite transporter (DMT)-like permease
MGTLFRKVTNHIKNSNFTKAFLLISMNVVIEAFADLFMKKGLLSTGVSIAGFDNLFQVIYLNLLSPWIWLGIIMYLASFIIWITALSHVELSIAYPIGSTSYILVPIISIIFLHETVPLLRWVGIIAIVLGIIVLSRSKSSDLKSEGKDFGVGIKGLKGNCKRVNDYA